MSSPKSRAVKSKEDERAEEDALLRQYASSSRADTQATLGQRAFYFFCALLVAATPVWLWHSIYEMEVLDNAAVFGLVTFVAAIPLTIGYHEVACGLKLKLKKTREDALGKERKESLDAKKRLQDQVTTRETMAFSVLYNNALFVVAVLVLGFYVFNYANPVYNYVLTIAIAAALVFLNSSRQVGL